MFRSAAVRPRTGPTIKKGNMKKFNKNGMFRLLSAIGTPEGDDGVVSAAFETTSNGFVVIAPALVREDLDATLGRLTADLPSGSVLEAQISGDDVVVLGTGFAGLPSLARAALAERVADAVCDAVRVEGGTR